MKKLLLLLLILLSFSNSVCAESSHGISIFGDLKYPKNFKHFEYTNPDAPKGGETRQGVIGTFDNLNSYILKGVAAEGLGLTTDTLMASADDEPFAKYGLIAESINVAPDKKSVTFTLRKEARWHDGKPITADDVVFSFDTLKNKGHPFYRTYYQDVKSAEKISDNEVRFNFATNKNRELPLIIGQLPILCKEYYDSHDFSKTTLEAPITSGPYEIEKVEAGKKLVLKRVDNYWGKDLPVNKGRYNFDRIIYDYYRDDTVAIEALKAYQYDLRLENVAKIWAKAYDVPAVKEGWLIKEEIKHEIPTGMQGFAFNIRRPKFADAKVREALNYAFDFEWSNKNLFFNAYTRTKSYFSNSEFASSGLPEGKELALLKEVKAKYKNDVPERVFTEEYNPPVTDGSGFTRENLKKAKTLLEEAGWVIKDGKLTNSKSGEVMKIEFMLNSPSFERVVAPVILNLNKLGIDANIRTVDAAQYQKREEDFDFDVEVNVFGESNSPGNEQVDYWHSSKADVKGSRNIIGIKNPAVDELVGKIISAQTKGEMLAATRALDRVLLWNFYVIPNWHVRSFRVIYWNKFGKPEIRPKYDLGFETWWIDAEKEAKLNEKMGRNK